MAVKHRHTDPPFLTSATQQSTFFTNFRAMSSPSSSSSDRTKLRSPPYRIIQCTFPEMSLENDTMALARRALVTHQGSGDPALEPPSPESRSASNSRSFYADELISTLVDQWRDSPNTFLDHVTEKCNVACGIYKKIRSLSEKPRDHTPLVDIIKRRVYLVQYYRLREEFKEIFCHQGSTDPLPVFLAKHVPGEIFEQLKKNCAAYVTSGRRYDELGNTTNHPGVLFLSTTFSSAKLESREIRHEVPEAAIESIRHVGQMEKYDEAAQIIHHILKNFWMDWLQRIKPPNTDVRTQVENLFSKPEISVLVFPSATCHETRADNLLSHDITSSMDPNHINPISETSNTAPRHMVVIRDAYGFERQFDFDILQQVIASVPDTSGHMRNVHISALADALMDYRFRTQTQSSSTFIPAIKMPEQFYYVGAEFAN